MTTRRFSSEPTTLNLPPFSRVVAWLLSINIVIFLFLEIMDLASATSPIARTILQLFSLRAEAVVHQGWLWQLFTYAFLHFDVLGILFDSLGIWFLGSLLESSFGSMRFLRYYFICILGTGIATLLLAYSGAVPFGPSLPIIGAFGAIDGLLIAIGMLYGETEFTLIPFPVRMKAKYLVAITIVVSLIISLREPGGILHANELGGLFAGFIYIKFFYSSPRRRPVLASRSMPGRNFAQPKQAPLLARWRDSYYRWKRRRAARKFEVYMRKHDRKVFFDEHGNYIDPDSPQGRDREREDGKSPWIN